MHQKIPIYREDSLKESFKESYKEGYKSFKDRLKDGFKDSKDFKEDKKDKEKLFKKVMFILAAVLVIAFIHQFILSSPQKCESVKELSIPPSIDTLVLVPGHAIYLGNNFSKSCLIADDCWILESFQKGQTKFFVEHIRRGIEIAFKNPNSLLIFSGGQTRTNAGPLSEGQSYFQLAHNVNWFGFHKVESRSTTEEFAKDSFENLLFSVCRFREMTGKYPTSIITVGFKFKEKRFVELHRHAIDFPLRRFQYVGVVDGQTDEIVDSAVKDFEVDLYGCKGNLYSKRVKRNPFNRTHSYRDTCPELADLLSYCGDEKFGDFLPWNEPK